MPQKTKIKIGQRIGKLMVIKPLSKKDRGTHPVFLCKCDCGKEIERSSDRLNRGGSQGCNRTCAQTLPNNQAIFNNLLKTYEYTAKIRKLDFLLTEKELRHLVSLNCAYCGNKPSQIYRGSNGSQIYYNGIDRIENDKGYAPDNCVPCCGVCNFMKKNMSVEGFLQHIDKIHNYRIEVISGVVTATDLTD